jgi:hypothetical protein
MLILTKNRRRFCPSLSNPSSPSVIRSPVIRIPEYYGQFGVNCNPVFHPFDTVIVRITGGKSVTIRTPRLVASVEPEEPPTLDVICHRVAALFLSYFALIVK